MSSTTAPALPDGKAGLEHPGVTVPGLVGQVGHPTDGGALHDDAPGLTVQLIISFALGMFRHSEGQICLGQL